MKILHVHYIKEVSTRAVINASSAHSEEMKMNVMVNEICRILKNCSIYLEWDEVAEHVNYFMKRLQYSGYSRQFRFKVVSRALAKYDKRMEEYRQNGTRYPMRTEMEKRERRQKKQEWFQKSGKYDSVMFVEATPNSELKKEGQRLAHTHGVRIKVVERVDTTVKQTVQRSDPFR